jgi:hypothetical protein
VTICAFLFVLNPVENFRPVNANLVGRFDPQLDAPLMTADERNADIAVDRD